MLTSDRPEPAAAGLEPAARRRRLASSAALFALATGLSRLLGLAREIVARNYFGVEGKINAFTVAFQVPNLIRALVADVAFTSAFVPVFSELLVTGQRRRAWAVASSLFWLLLLGLGGLVALGILLAPLVVSPFGVPLGAEDLTVGLTRLLFPIVVLLGVSGVFVGLLNSYERFALPALSPVAWNLVIISRPRPGRPPRRLRGRQALRLRPPPSSPGRWYKVLFAGALGCAAWTATSVSSRLARPSGAPRVRPHAAR